MKTPHIHAALIKAWADGAEIEYLNVGANSVWDVAKSPRWDGHGEYRIKSEPKPDVVEQYFASGSVFRQRLHHPQCLAYGLVCNSARVADMKEALKRALEALEEPKEHIAKHLRIEAITAIKAALAQPTSGDYALGYAEGFNDACKPKPAQEPDHGDELTIAYMSGVHRGKELAAQPAPVQPVGIVETLGGYPDESRHEVKWLVPYRDLKDGDKLYRTPQAQPAQEPVALAQQEPDYAYPTIEGYEEITGFKVNDTFRMGWAMARTTNDLFKQMEKNT